MSTGLKITGRIRDESNSPVSGCSVEGFVENPRARGTARTDSSGHFEMLLSGVDVADLPARKVEVGLRIGDKDGEHFLEIKGVENDSGLIDFQVKLIGSQKSASEPDIYSRGLERMLTSYESMAEKLDLANDEVRMGLQALIKVVREWPKYKEELARAYGLEVVQVPKYPRKQPHVHVSKWNEVGLPE